MPWTVQTAKRHNKNANEAWTKVANSILKKYGDDAKAIKIANAAIKKVKK
jgi:translation initiation factor 2 alpha subunit (eIF-2alpha)